MKNAGGILILFCHTITASLEIQTLGVQEKYSGLTSNILHDLVVF